VEDLSEEGLTNEEKREDHYMAEMANLGTKIQEGSCSRIGAKIARYLDIKYRLLPGTHK